MGKGAARIPLLPRSYAVTGGVGTRTGLFDWLRLGGAFAVLVGHSYVLTGNPPLLGIGWHAYGVMLFFAISGYLITGSWQADPDPLRYAVKRARRIMPGLIVVVLATALVLGPLLSVDPAAYWAGAWRYVWRNVLLLPLHVLPGVFTANPYPVAVNGSLWTLPVEVFMYAMTPLLVRAGPMVCAVAAGALYLHPLTQHIAGFGLEGASGVIPWFLGGATLRLLNVPPPRGWRYRYCGSICPMACT